MQVGITADLAGATWNDGGDGMDRMNAVLLRPWKVAAARDPAIEYSLVNA